MKDLLLPPNLDASYSEWEPGIDPRYTRMRTRSRLAWRPPRVRPTTISKNPAFVEDLERITGRSLRIHVTQRGIFDARPVSIISLSTAARLGEELGKNIDKRRFRANFYVEWENQDDPFFELSLVGRTLKIGEWLELMIVERDPRCSMITLDPDTAEPTPKLLQHLARKHEGDAGVFAAVLKRGRVNQGDPIVLK